MKIKNIVKSDWLKRLISRCKSNKKSHLYDRNPFKEFDKIGEEISRMFDQLYILTPNPTKEMVSDYQTPKYDKLQQEGPTVFGYTMTVGSVGRPQVIEFGNVTSFVEVEEMEKARNTVLFGDDWFESISTTPKASTEREPMADVNSTEKEVKVVLELIGVKEEDIAINACDGKLDVLTSAPQRNHHKLIELPQDADTETAKFTYNNGLLEVTFKKKKTFKPKGKEIKIE
jgi:HSP20 family protein